MSEQKHDLAVIGGGPAGYVAAIRAAQLGLDVACVDENSQLGGTCARVGCIPSKALLESTHLFHKSQREFAAHGITVGTPSMDIAKMQRRKDKVVSTLTGGIQMLLKHHKIKTYQGRGRFADAKKIEVASANGNTTIETKNTLIAVGSKPSMMPGIEFDGDLIGDSTTALSYTEVPKRLVIIGAGVIGLELGSVWNRLGSEVIFLEALEGLLPTVDQEIAKLAKRTFDKQGLTFRFKQWVEGATIEDGRCLVRVKDSDPIESDRVLLCTGRTPNTQDLGLDQIGVKTDRHGFIGVDKDFGVGVDGVFAVGDCIGGAMLAHKASEEGIACVEKMVTGAGSVHYGVIPSVVYTWPEIASVGKTEQELVEQGIQFSKGVCPYGANGRARALGEIEGRVKILADAKTDRILGVHIIGAYAGDLIAEVTAAMSFGASSEDLARTCHAHPSLSEILAEAAMAVNGNAIHTA